MFQWTKEVMDGYVRLMKSLCSKCRGSKSSSSSSFPPRSTPHDFFFFFFFYEWEHRTGTMCPFSSLHPLKKGKEV